jgi:hypothetical protein
MAHARLDDVRAKWMRSAHGAARALALQTDRRLFSEPPAASERAGTLQLILVGDQAEPHLGGTAWSWARSTEPLIVRSAASKRAASK